MRAIIVDDERDAIEILENQIYKLKSELKIIATTQDSDEARKLLQLGDFDVLFLDIQLKDASGFELLAELDDIDFEVVFTTAYDEYAIDAFKVNALDYLLKPIDLKDLKRVVKKLEKKGLERDQKLMEKLQNMIGSPEDSGKIVLKERGQISFLKKDKILYFKAEGAYTKIVMRSGESHVSSQNLGHYEDEMMNTDFVRTHRSYLINPHEVESFITSDSVAKMSNGDLVNVSDSHREKFLQLVS